MASSAASTPVIGAGEVAGIILIPCDEAGAEAAVAGGIVGQVQRAHDAGDQDRDAAPDEAAHGIEGQGGVAVLGQQGIDPGMNVRGAVDQRAVEIEDERAGHQRPVSQLPNLASREGGPWRAISRRSAMP
jgi:hypothetical protein